MPNIGGVYVPDELMPGMPRAARARPGLGAIVAANAEGVGRQLKAAIPYQFEVLTRDKVDPNLEQQYKQGLAEANAAFARGAPAQVSDVTGGRVGIGRFIAENIAASLPQMGAMVAGGVGGALVAGPGGALAGASLAGTPIFSASNVGRAVEENGSLDVGAAERSFLAAPVQAAADSLVGRFLPGAGRLLGGAAATQSGNFLRRTAASMGKAGITEAITEAGQQVGERAAAGISVSSTDAVAEYVNAAVTAFAVGGTLGAAGGFRRTNAVAKPVADVTVDDLNEDIDQHLNGQPLALPAPEVFGRSSLPPPLALPAPSDVKVDVEGTARVNPSGTIQLALPAPDPAPPPGLEEFPAGVQGAVRFGADMGITPPLTASTALSRGLGAVPGFEPEAPRAPAAAPVVLGTPEVPFADTLAEVKKGVSTNQWVKKLDAQDETELFDRVYDQIFTEQDTRAGTIKLAQRIGILDEDMKPGIMAVEVETRRAAAPEGTAAAKIDAGGSVQNTAPPPAATSSTDVGSPTTTQISDKIALPVANDPADVEAVAEAKKAIGVQREGPLKTLNTPADVFAAIADDAVKAKWGGEATRVEKLAKQLGLITNDDAMDYTPKGRTVYLQSAQGIEATTSAAADNGFAGASASQFDRGARAAVGGQEQTTFANFEEMAAYNAGKTWAQDFVQNGEILTAEQTRGVMDRQAARTTGVAVPRQGVERTQLTPLQVQQRSLNGLLDTVDLSDMKDTDVAALFRMVRDGAAPAEVSAALQQAQGGKTLFLQPEAAAPAPLTKPTGRGQPRFREMNTPTAGPSRAAQRGETTRALKRKALSEEIDAAYASEDITAKERLILIHKLTRDDFKGVVDRLPGGPLRNDMDISRRGFLAGVVASAVVSLDPTQARATTATRTAPTKELLALLRSGNIVAILDYMARRSDNVGYRLIAQKLHAAAGWDKVNLGLADDQGSLYGTTQLNDDGSSDILLYGEHGVEEETVLHELIHAFVQQRWAGVSVYNERNEKLLNAQGDRRDSTIRGFAELWDKIGNALKATNPELVENEAWAANFYASPDEALSWLLTNKQAQAYLRSIDEYGVKVNDNTLWDRFVQWIGDLLGVKLNSKTRTALDQLLDSAHSLLDAGKDVRTDDFAPKMAAGLAKQQGRMELRTVGATTETLTSFASSANQVLDKITPDDLKITARRKMLGWLSHNQINRLFGRVMPGLLKHTEAHRWRDAVRANFESMGDEVYQGFEKLERENKNAAEWVGQLMALTTEFQVDPDKPWNQHTHHGWITGSDGKPLPDPRAGPTKERERHKPMYDAAVKLKNDLSRGNGDGYALFNQFRAFNEAQNFARLSAQLHNLVAMDPELQLGVSDALVNPTEQFLKQEGLTTSTAIRDWWQKSLMQQIAATTEFVNVKKGTIAADPASDQAALRQHLAPIEMQISAIHEALAGMQKSPYFHLGRFGDYFASAKVRTNADGTVNSEAMEKVAAAIAAAGFDDVQISEANNRPKIAMRFDTNDQTQKFKALMVELHRQGLLEGDLKTAVQAGARSRENNFGNTDGFPVFVQNYIEALEASPLYTPAENATPEEKQDLARRKDEAIRLALDTWLEAQPDTAISKVLAKRYTVPGYKKDMIRNYAHRWRVGAISLANVASAPKFAEAFVDMRSAVEEAKGGDSTADQPLLNDLLAEMKMRDATTPLNDNADSFDKARAIAHSYFLGLSPAYALINMTQMGVVALPELAKKHGYSKSFHAMRRASGDAMKILKAAFNEARELGPENWANVAITESVLTKAGLSPEKARFAMRMIASGTIDIGSQSRALGQVSENRVGNKLDMGLKYASALGMYSETFSRLTTALAANELHPGDLDSSADYATKVVSESMLDYQSWNTARNLGKKGILGPVTPIVTQFMSYSVQMTEKLMTEFVNAIGRPRPGETAEQTKQRAKEARTFVLGHLTAITALTGTLGLPFMTVFARTLELMVDQFDDDEEPFDITASYRGFLADVLGKEVAEVASRGLPRALGFDLSSRAGEQNLLPFSEFYADARPWKEAVEANLGRSLGAVPSMVTNIITGGGKIADGDVMAGMKDMLPVAFKGPIESYRMTADGYIDGQGNKLPMTPGASALVWQLLGFTPAGKAEYSEIRGDLAARKGEISRRAGVLRDQIVKALMERDNETAQALLEEAQEFDVDNPEVQLVASVPAALQRRAMGQVRATALRTPLGVSMNDIAGQEMSRYANGGY